MISIWPHICTFASKRYSYTSMYLCVLICMYMAKAA